MQDLYRGFKKVSEDEHGAVLEHEQGHRLNIAKSGLSKKHLKALKQIPLHQAKPQEPIQPQESEDVGNQLEQVGRDIADAVAEKVSQGALQSVDEQLSPEQIAQMPEPVATDVQTGEPVYKGVGGLSPEERYQQSLGPQEPVVSPLNVISEGFKPGQGGKTYGQIKQELEQPKQKAREQATESAQILETEQPDGTVTDVPVSGGTSLAFTQQLPEIKKAPAVLAPMKVAVPLTPQEVIASDRATPSQKMNAFFQMAASTVEERKQRRNQYVQQVQDRQLETKKLFSGNTGQNILTAIGLLLGGMSAGILRTENPVLKMINDEIDRDIKRQMKNFELEDNLFKDEMSLYNDEQSAYISAANNLRAVALAQMEEAMGKLDPNNQAGKLAIQTTMRQMRETIDQLDAADAMRKNKEKILSALNSTSGMSNMDPASIVNLIVDNEADKRQVLKEIEDASVVAQNYNSIMKLFDDAARERKKELIDFIPGVSYRTDSSKMLEQAVAPLFKNLEGVARQAAIDRTVRNIFPDWKDNDVDVQRKKEAMKNWLSATQSAPTARAYNLDLNKFTKTKAKDEEDLKKEMYLNYANQNLNSPDPERRMEAQYILRKYGR